MLAFAKTPQTGVAAWSSSSGCTGTPCGRHRAYATLPHCWLPTPGELLLPSQPDDAMDALAAGKFTPRPSAPNAFRIRDMPVSASTHSRHAIHHQNEKQKQKRKREPARAPVRPHEMPRHAPGRLALRPRRAPSPPDIRHVASVPASYEPEWRTRPPSPSPLS